MKKLIIDPVTRIEGHLRVEVAIDERGVVKEASAAGMLFRGIEIILKGRDPRDAALLAQRICGVCTNSHYRASISAVENAYGIKIPKNAEIIRDLVSLAQMIQDHVVHFYHLHLLDFVDVKKVLKADSQKASQEAYRYSPHPYRNSKAHLEEIKQKIKKFFEAGKLGLFANGSWGHKEYKFSAEECLILMSHYFEALKFQREISKAIAIFAGKTPHPQNLVIGGVTRISDKLNPKHLRALMFLIKETREFIKMAYLPDMVMLAQVYKEEMKKGNGRTSGNFMSVGGYSLDEENTLFESGIIYGHDFKNLYEFDPSKITESVARSWYAKDSKDIFEDASIQYTDLKDDGSLKSEEKYSWIKSPRYDGHAMECGPLARMTIGYLKKNPQIAPYMQKYLDLCDLKLIDLSSAVGRNFARAIESEIVSDYLFDFVNVLVENIKYYDEETYSGYEFSKLPKDAVGVSFFEVPRGILTHFINIKDAKIENYQVIAPTTWNASPKDENNIKGAYEESLIGIKIQDPDNPLEVLRIIRSFDPCIACAVHTMQLSKNSTKKFKVC